MNQKVLIDAINEEWEKKIESIKAEIEQITDTMGVSYYQYVPRTEVLEIIDKHISGKESE